MTTNRLYTVAWIYDNTNDEPYDLEDELEDAQRADPDGWAEFCEAKWGEYKPFFWPSTKRIYRSRSAAVERAALINHWGGNVVVLECTPEWVTLAHAQRQREIDTKRKRLEVLRGKIGTLESAAKEVCTQIDALVFGHQGSVFVKDV
ncbi:hypothetical protein QYR02_02425 [Microbacterium maritypicum]|uniref:hypothetical protein n=1 Tax=Microbacterium maritypicum TaxID=33918 RepID=UPI0026719A90|nr:hypothetical protein [Microbacterium liquefaciens]WKT89789.1 hypothetical protein QYR02_02425 [Microbacterium liquefaciens]